MPRPELSVVIPVYGCRSCLEALYQRLKSVLGGADLARIDVLPVTMEFEDQAEIAGLLRNAIVPKR